MKPELVWTDALLDVKDQTADPFGDNTVKAIFDNDGLNRVNELLAELHKNDQVPKGFSPAVAAYLEQSAVPPPWKNSNLIQRGEKLFFDHGLMSVLVLFCSSLPACFVLKSEARVLHLAGNLEAHTERRIRETARMIFPVMEKGGLGIDGKGIRQIQKVRLIHSTIRHLILHPVSEHLLGTKPTSLADALHQTRWDTAKNGLPINQEQLAYTLLTFGYVFVRSIQQLGIKLTEEEEMAYIHCWNVAGHHLGIDHGLMAHTMSESEALFSIIQLRHSSATEHGQSLTHALLATMEKQIDLPVVRPFPAILMRMLLGSHISDLLGIQQRYGLLTRVLFAGLRGLIWTIDEVMKFFHAESWTVRFVSRVLARRFIKHLLIKNAFDTTEPLHLPDELLNGWKREPGRWRINQQLEDYFVGGRADV